MAEGLPETHSPFAAEGTAAHMLAEKVLSGGSEAADWKGWMIDTGVGYGMDPWHRPDYPGMKANDSTVFKVDNQMIDAVQMFVDVAREVADDSDEFEIEQRLDLAAILADSGGTGDFVAYSEEKQRVTIGDLKYGKGVAVDVEENEQELTYAVGVALKFHNRGVKEIELIIVQPRAPHRHGPVRRWTLSVDKLYAHAMELQDAADLVQRARSELTPDKFVPGSHCKFCKAIPVCGALEQRVKDIIGFGGYDIMGNPIIDDPAKYDADTLAQKLKDKPMVDMWSKGTEQFAHAEALRGNMPTGFKLVGKRATRKWKNEDDAVMTLRLAGVSDDDIFVSKVQSPAQVETAIPKKERETLFAELVTKQSSGTVLAEISDPRAAVDPNDARGFEPVSIVERE